jgi:YcxB-like protein
MGPVRRVAELESLVITAMITATLEELDYLNAQSLHRRWSQQKTIVVIFLAIFAGALGCVLWYQGAVPIAGGIVGGLIGGIAGGSIVRYVYVPRKARKVFRQQKSFQREFSLSWNNDGVRSKDANGEYSTGWSDFIRWKENERLFLLYVSDIQFYMVPKRAFNGEVELRDFRDHLVRSVRV